MKYKINKIFNNKQKIIIFCLLLIFSIFSINISFASDLGCGALGGKERYDCQIKNNCEDYKPKNFHFKTNNYFFPKKEFSENNKVSEKDKTFGNFLKGLRGIKNNNNGSNNLGKYLKQKNIIEVGKIVYRENQNSIYACAIIDLQKKGISLIKKELFPINKTGDLKSSLEKKFDLKIKKLESIEKQKECISPQNQEEKNNVLNPKQEILNESAYEFCKYNYYLDFLKNYYKNIENVNNTVLNKTEASKKTISKVASMQNKIQENISNEEIHSQKVFNMAFETYVDYENYYPVHILLEVIKEDFKILRRKFHQAISPINQVVYKISNAMSK